jgi:hypothetical protein
MFRLPGGGDTTGRLADGYRVVDLPWVAVTASGGTISYHHHDGWLTASALALISAQALRLLLDLALTRNARPTSAPASGSSAPR